VVTERVRHRGHCADCENIRVFERVHCQLEERKVARAWHEQRAGSVYEGGTISCLSQEFAGDESVSIWRVRSVIDRARNTDSCLEGMERTAMQRRVANAHPSEGARGKVTVRGDASCRREAHAVVCGQRKKPYEEASIYFRERGERKNNDRKRTMARTHEIKGRWKIRGGEGEM
jgi:hypothetical protein